MPHNTELMRATVGLILLVLFGMSFRAAADLVEIETRTPLKAVYLIPDNSTELITVGMVIIAGEVDFDGPEGLSHYLEHLMFWHADTLGKETTMHSRGGNAWVNGIITTYFNVGEASDLEDMFTFTERLLTPPTLKNTFMLDERKVVEREYDLRISENPDRRVLTDMRKQLYDNHPASRSVIGTPTSIRSLTLDQARAFHNDFYHAANAVLFVRGNVSDSQIINLVNSRFSDLPEIVEHSQAWRKRSITGPLDVTRQYPEPQARSERLAYASLSSWPDKEDAQQNEYTRQFTERLLRSALPGSLAKPLRLDQFIVSEYQLEITQLLDKQVELVVVARPDDGVTLSKVGQSLQAALTHIGKSGIPEKTLARIRKRWLQTAQRESNNPQTTQWRTFQMLSMGLLPNTNADHLQRIEAVSKADVDSLLAALGDPQRKILGHIKAE